MSKAFLCSMFSDRLIPERMLLMEEEEGEQEGEVEVAPMGELAFDGCDSWKGVEGCIEVVLSAISGKRLSPESGTLWQVSENEADFCCVSPPGNGRW